MLSGTVEEMTNSASNENAFETKVVAFKRANAPICKAFLLNQKIRMVGDERLELP